MLDDNHRGAMINQCAKHGEQCFDIFGMKTDGRFIKHEDGIILRSAHLTGQFESLRFAAGKTGCFLTQGQITKTKILENLQSWRNRLHIRTECKGMVNVHIHQLREGFSFTCFVCDADFLCLHAIAAAMTLRTGNIHIGQKLHIQGNLSGAIAHLTSERTGIV